VRIISVAAIVLACACVSAETPASDQTSEPPKFDGKRAFEHIERLVAIGPRSAGSEGIQKTRDYIKQQLTAIGLTPVEQPFEAQTPIGPVKMVNISARIPWGSSDATFRVIFAGHYDTKLSKDFTFVGANDGGSSTAFLLELARVLKGRKNFEPIEILFLDGEEAFGEWESGNTWGSRHYVEQAQKTGEVASHDLRALILVDMIGDRNLTIKREAQSTPWLTDIIWSAARQLKRPEFVAAETPISDDHLPFLQAGIPAVDIIDLEYPDASNAYWHTAEDTIDKVSAESLQAVGDVLLAALPGIEIRVK
jgi:Zn-dependent M28 family amino/carboxypeptidase